MYFFWQWGSPSGATSAVTSVTTAPTLWTTITAATQHWGTVGINRIPRFEHVYPQPTVGFASGGMQDFVFRVASQNAFIIQTGNAVFVKSSTSNLP